MNTYDINLPDNAQIRIVVRPDGSRFLTVVNGQGEGCILKLDVLKATELSGLLTTPFVAAARP